MKLLDFTEYYTNGITCEEKENDVRHMIDI